VINNDTKLIRFKNESIKTKKKKMKYSLTTYHSQLIKFYNCFIRHDDNDGDDKIRIKNKSNYKLSIENENNVILVNEVKSNTSVSFDSLNDMTKIEKTFLTLDNCKEINPNSDGNKKKSKT